MARKPKTGVAKMWINPHSNLSQVGHEWDRRITDAGNGRYLELAEVALRPATSKPKKAKVPVAVADEIDQ
jgi:hypothetical protein